ncbi:hypothetical protein ACIPI6_23980 [Pseudomonas protegens]|uniref:hypothetical protein n=1 Tax=Pseudomonas protegens TaxID=380021 RepID=UPI0037FB8303
MSQRGGSDGFPLVGIALVAVAIAIFLTVLKFSQLFHLDLETGSSVVLNLLLTWGLLYSVGLATRLGLRTLWPIGLGFTWLAFMPAFGVWFTEDWYVWVSSWWGKFGALILTTCIGFWIKTL